MTNLIGAALLAIVGLLLGAYAALLTFVPEWWRNTHYTWRGEPAGVLHPRRRKGDQ